MAARRTPKASRPGIPYGIVGEDEGAGLLPWERAVDRLRSAYAYWIATTCDDGRPHSIPVWGVWLDDAFYFSNGATTRTGRNLWRDPRITVHLESGEDAVIVEGVAEAVRDDAIIDRVNAVYGPKYLWDERMPDWYRVVPQRAFGWLCPSIGRGSEGVYRGTATRWQFDR